MDDALVALAIKYDALRLELDRIVKQRNTLLRQVGGKLDDEAAFSSTCGTPSSPRPVSSSAGPGPRSSSSRAPRAGGVRGVGRRRRPRSTMATTRRGGTVVSPRRSRPRGRRPAPRRVDRRTASRRARASYRGHAGATHASQGEQRTLALALRLGVHRLVADRTGSNPVLVLDDVLSELDAHRATALLASLPAGQIVITTAGVIPLCRDPDRVIRIAGGSVVNVRRSGLPTVRSRRRNSQPIRPTLERGRSTEFVRSLQGGAAAGGAAAVGGVFGRWAEIVGNAMAAQVQPVRLEGDRLAGRSARTGVGDPGPPAVRSDP